MASNSRLKRGVKDWRKKEANQAKIKYNRDSILECFTLSECPSIPIPDILKSPECLTPILTSTSTSISFPLICQNSRRSGKATKREKSVNFKIAICLTNPDENLETEEKPGKSLSLSFIDDKKDPIESYIKYPELLFNSFVQIKNPFATLINSYCSRSCNNVFPLNKSFEKIWFYKDLIGRVQGPFSSVEMFNWTAAGYFTSHLMVAKGDKLNFFALSSFY